MSATLTSILLFFLGLIIGIVLVIGINFLKNKKSEKDAINIVEKAKKEAEKTKRNSILEAKEEMHKLKLETDKEIKEKKQEIKEAEDRLLQRENNIDRRDVTIQNREDAVNERENNLLEKQKEIQEKEAEMEEIKKQQLEKLESIAKFSKEKAHDLIMKTVEESMTKEIATYIKEKESEAKLESDNIAKEMIIDSMQKYAADVTNTQTVSVISLPNDEMKGRIIGREGRNIRAIETQTGVDLIIDDTPEAVIISGFDPVRREIARLALEKLITDGRIHPARIEEMVKKAEAEVNAVIKEEGERATFEADVHNLHPEVMKLLGRLKYRTSYGQNVLNHSIEVAHLAGLMAGELGLNVKLAKRAGLLHDIGKALTHEHEGTHVDLGISVLTKYKESEEVINGVAAHHGDYEAKTPEAVLIAAADALSAARPGARRETLDVYIKRLEKLEEIANTTPGVDKSFAIQAGREIRIIANPDEIGDDSIELLARDIAKRVETEMEYPGQIKINVVRETRAVEYAK